GCRASRPTSTCCARPSPLSSTASPASACTAASSSSWPGAPCRRRRSRSASTASCCSSSTAGRSASAPSTCAPTSWWPTRTCPTRRRGRSTGGWCWGRPPCSSASPSRCGPSFWAWPRPPAGDHSVGPVRIPVPLVTRTELLDFVVETVARARAELEREGLEHAPTVALGVMIEVAAATAMVEAWAEHVDYFALGTNDLTASALGLDRDDPVAVGQLDALHPGLLRLIHEVVTQAHRAGRTVTVCGEMAADPQGCLALVALQVDALSVPVNQLRAVRRGLAGLSPGKARELVPHLLRQ